MAYSGTALAFKKYIFLTQFYEIRQYIFATNWRGLKDQLQNLCTYIFGVTEENKVRGTKCTPLGL
jgi:hypothetical protein